jgi:hypothetical protein
MLEQLEHRTEPAATAAQGEEQERDWVTPRLVEQIRPYTDKSGPLRGP